MAWRVKTLRWVLFTFVWALSAVEGQAALVAHWPLDETRGTTAGDVVGGNDGTLHGDPVWQAATPRPGGALQFDGTDDFITTGFVLDPARGQASG